MKTTVEDISSVKKRLNVVVPREEVERELTTFYSNLRKRVRIKGFRPGKAPLRMIERLYREEAEGEVAAKLIGDSYPKAIQEENLKPLGTPSFEKGTLAKDEDFTYSATFEIAPQVEVQGYFELTLEREDREVTPEDVDREIERIRQAHAQLATIEDRGLEPGDVAVIDYFMTDPGISPDTARGEGVHIELGKGVVPDLENGLIGLVPGDEKELEVTYPEEYAIGELAGKTVSMRIRVVDAKSKVLPELDDEFVKDLDTKAQTVEELREQLRKQLEEQERLRVEASLNKQILDRLLEMHSFEVPETLMEAQLNSMVENYERTLARQGLTAEVVGTDLGELRESYRPRAEERVRATILLNRIADQEGIEITDEDLDRGFEDLARQTGQSKEFIRSLYHRNKMVEGFRSQLLEEKVLKVIREHATIVPKTEASGKDPEQEG